MIDILAIDPGPTQSGYVVLRDSRIASAGVLSNPDALYLIDDYFAGFEGVLTERPVAIEMIASYGMPVGAETFNTCRWIGKFELYCEQKYAERPLLVFRKDVKLHLCGSMKAKDANVRQALIDRFGKAGTKKDKGPTYGVTSHAWSALAVAAYAMDHPV